MKKPYCKETRLINKGHIIEFRENTMVFENKNEAKWDFIHHMGAAAVVPVSEDGRIFMVKQYRPGVDDYTLEIPAGCINPGEDRKTAAIRELEEEIGFKSNNVDLLVKYYSAPAYCDEYIEIYLAKDLVKTHQHLDANEDIEVSLWDINELVKKVQNFEIIDGKTIAGIFAYAQRLN